MSTAKVFSIQTLPDLSAAFSRFAGEANSALTAVEAEIQRTLEFLQKRLHYWQQEVRRRERLYQQAQQALQRCLNTVYYDRDGRPHRPSCDAERTAVAKARKALEDAREELEKVRRWLERVQQTVQEYRREAGRLRDLASTRTEQARAFLSRKHAELMRYIHMVGPDRFYRMLREGYNRWRARAASIAIREAKRQEIELVQKTGRGTRPWTKKERAQLARGVFPKGYVGHHINSVSAYPHLADYPDNITFVRGREHYALHRGSWQNPTSGKMFNRKSLMVQWAKD